MNYIFITGVSTGIGYDTTKLLLSKGYFVIGTVRNDTDAQRLKNEFQSNFKVVRLDVTKEETFKTALVEVENITQDNGLSAIINNAGIAVPGPLQYLNIEDLKLQFDVNVIGLTRTTQVFFPLLLAGTSPGRIINIGSISGRITLPFIGAYAASKHAVEALSDAFRREFFIHKVKVVNIQPSAVTSEIWQKAIDQKSKYLHTEYSPILKHMEKNIQNTIDAAIPVRKVSEKIWHALTHPRPKPRYIVSKSNWKTRILFLIPDTWVDKLIMKNVQKYWKNQ